MNNQWYGVRSAELKEVVGYASSSTRRESERSYLSMTNGMAELMQAVDATCQD